MSRLYTAILALVIGISIGSLWGWISWTKEPPSREAEILGWIQKNEPSPAIFCPNIEDRQFWDARPLGAKKQPPPQTATSNLRAINAAGLGGIITEGTDQELSYNTGEWLPIIEKTLLELLDTPWTEQIQTKEFTDLHATATGANIARTINALKPKLNPALVEKALLTIRRKITGPYLKDLEKFQKEKLNWSIDMCPWLEGTSNWNAVCVSNIIYTVLATEADPKTRAHTIAASEAPLRQYLKSAEEDGYLGSGIRYWNYGFGHLLTLNERLAKATGGEIILSDEPKIQKIGVFKNEWLISKKGETEIFPLFADNNNPTERNLWLDLLCHIRIGTTAPESQPRMAAGNGPLTDLLVWLPEIKPASGATVKKDSTFYASAGALISRHANKRTVLAIKGGSNQEEHNHNDVGSYTLFDDGNYVTGDAGTVGYKIEMFGPRRYEEDILSSYGHPVPVVNNHLQTNAVTSGAKVMFQSIEPLEDKIVYDITTAYKTPGLISVKRTMIFKKEGNPEITIIDEFEAERPIKFESPLIYSRGKRIGDKIEMGNFIGEFTSDAPLEFEDSRFWKDNTPMKRFAAIISEPRTKGQITLRILNTR